MDKKNITRILILLLFALLLTVVFCQSASLEENDPATRIDARLKSILKDDQPGAAVIVVRDGKTIFRRGYGLADVENQLPVKPEHVFRLGSITKQFTAVGIMMLKEEGKLKLDDLITKYLPDYPLKGRKVTIRHLLTHTSGIQSYTGMRAWVPLMIKDMTVEEIINIFKDQPFNFEPGEQYLYNNSGYFLLGAIIEKTSGKSYEDFIQERIFTPLGMSNSYYGHPQKIVPNRARGYKSNGRELFNCSYISMTHPYSAGALLSTVDDMAKWDAALYTEKLVSKESLEQCWTPQKLNSGKEITYGFGWMLTERNGVKLIAHGGGINGFRSYAIRIPAKRLYIAVLRNLEGGTAPGELVKIIYDELYPGEKH